MMRKLFVKQFRLKTSDWTKSVDCVRYKIIKTLNLTNFAKSTEIGKILTLDSLKDFVLYSGWEVEIS